MRNKNSIIILLFFLCSCGRTVKEKSKYIGKENKDTIAHEAILYEINDELKKNNVYPIKEYIYTKLGDTTDGFQKGDTFFLQEIYSSKKYPRLNNSYEINLYSEDENLKVLRQVNKNTFLVYVSSKADTVFFNVGIESDKVVFKSFYFEKNKKFLHEIELFRGVRVVN